MDVLTVEAAHFGGESNLPSNAVVYVVVNERSEGFGWQAMLAGALILVLLASLFLRSRLSASVSVLDAGTETGHAIAA